MGTIVVQSAALHGTQGIAPPCHVRDMRGQAGRVLAGFFSEKPGSGRYDGRIDSMTTKELLCWARCRANPC
ncbi:hypothetical protein GCM10022279_24370 [Comamonas faecalis]|uniref:Uncharacterized protein n=1 Tax=Comamonas faecalis TaxID=1387849 RepID=A0ABP7RN61_9BURK